MSDAERDLHQSTYAEDKVKELNLDYFKALADHNTELAQKIVNEAATAAGYEVAGSVDDTGFFCPDKEHCYRGNRDNMISGESCDLMMFTDDPYLASSEGEPDKMFCVRKDDLPDIEDFREEFIEKFTEYRTTMDMLIPTLNPFSLLNDVSAAEVANGFNPDNIYDTSGDAWNNKDLVKWFWDNIGEKHGLSGVRTQDGAILFDGSLVKRVANTETVIYDKTGSIVPLTERFDVRDRQMNGFTRESIENDRCQERERSGGMEL